MQVTKLKREFEILHMKNSETIKIYTNKLKRVVNQIKMLSEGFLERKLVEKMLVGVPKKF